MVDFLHLEEHSHLNGQHHHLVPWRLQAAQWPDDMADAFLFRTVFVRPGSHCLAFPENFTVCRNRNYSRVLWRGNSGRARE